MNNYQAFETDRLLLQPTSTSDAQLIFELLNSPKWLKYIGDRKSSFSRGCQGLHST